MELIERLHNSRAALVRYGFAEYSRRVLHHLRGFLYKKQASTVFRRDLTAPVEIIDARIPLQVEFYGPAKRAELHAFLDPYVRGDVTEWRLRQGWTPALAYHDGQLVALSWYSLRPLYLDSTECYLNYGSGAAYIEGSRTTESAQGFGVAPAIRTRICRHLREQGCREVYVSAGDDNKASQAVARKCGFTPYESVELTRILCWRRHRRARLG